MKNTELNGYNLTRNWYDFRFDNPQITKPSHSDLYFYIIDLWNRLGQKEKFGLPTSVTMECLGIGSYNTYKKNLNDLISFGFITLIQESKNQHKSKIIALSNYDKAHIKATDDSNDRTLDKAHINATDDIDKQFNNKQFKQINNKQSDVDLKNQPPSIKIDFQGLILFFNENRGLIPEVKNISDLRKKMILNIEKKYDKKTIQVVIEKARDSEFLQGSNKEGWIASFDWIFKPSNFLKILEDNYANKIQVNSNNNNLLNNNDHKRNAVNAVNSMFGKPIQHNR